MKSNKNVKLLKVLAFPASAAFMLGVGVTAIHADDDVAELTPITTAADTHVVLETSDNEAAVVEVASNEASSTSEFGGVSEETSQDQAESDDQKSETASAESTKESASNTTTAAKTASTPQVVSNDTAVAKETYTITFDANGGSGAPESITAESGSTITIPTVKPTSSKEGYEFLGWAYSATGTSKLPVGSSLTVTKDQTLYAIYKKAYKLVYHWADGSTTEDTRFVSDSQTSTTANLYNRIFQIKDYRYYDGMKVIGFASKEGSTEVEYQLYQRMTLSDETPLINVYSVFGDLDDAEFKVVVIYKDGETETRSDAVTATVKCKNDGLDHPSSTTQHYSTYADVYNAALNAVTLKDHYTITGFAQSNSAGTSYTLRDATSTSRTQFYTDKNSTGIYYLIVEKDAYDYTLKFDAKGGENAPEEIGVYKGEKVTIPETTPTKEGYTFKGWTTNSAATSRDNRYNAKRTVSISKDTTLYAVWEKTYSIVYHLSTGGTSVDDAFSSNTGSKTVYTHSRVFQIADYTAQVDQGKKLIGWTTVEGGTEVEYGLGAKINLTEDNPSIDLYSVYGDMDDAKVKVVVVTKNGETYTEREAVDATIRCKNYATNHPTSGSMHQNTMSELYAAATGAASIPAHYSIVGFSYHTNSAGEYELVDSTSTSQLNYSDGQTIYLIVEKDAYDYTLKFDAKGGENAPEEIGVYKGEKVTIPETTPTREGYTFKGWTTNSAATSRDNRYNAKRTVSISKDTTLYAVWEKTYSIVYHLSTGGTSVDDAYSSNTGSKTVYTHSRVFQIADYTAQVDQGKKLIGWTTVEGGTEVEYGLGAKINLTEDNPSIDLYSVYGDMDDAKVKVVVVTKNGETYTESEAVDATIRCKNYAVDHPTSGSMHQNTMSELYAAATGAASIPAHYSIVGFAYHTNSAGEYELVDGTSASQLNYYDGQTLYLIVEQETYSYTIAYYGGNKTEGYTQILPSDSGEALGGTTVKISETVPEKEGYKFLGWTALFKQDQGVIYQPGDEVTIDTNRKNFALLAVWEELATYHYYIYYYDGNKQMMPYDYGEVTEGTKIKVSETTPTKEGYTFKGWTAFFMPSVGVIYQPGDEITITSNKNFALKAVWEANDVDYNVTFQDDEGTVYDSISGQVKYGETTTITIPDTKPAHQEGLIFQGWVVAGNTHHIYKAGDTFEVSADNPNVVLYAHFTTGGGADVNPGGDDSGKEDPGKGDDSKKDDTNKGDSSEKTDPTDKTESKDDTNKSDASDKSDDATGTDSSSTVTTISYVANNSGSTATSESTTSSSSDSVQTSAATNGTLFSTMAALSGALALAFFKKRDDE